MRKSLLAILIVFLNTCIVNAQIKNGFVFLGGDISGSTQKTKYGDITTNKQNGINISPVFGKAIKDNLVLGVNAGANIYNNDNPPENGVYDTKAYNVGVFLRKYKNISTSGFYIFVQGGLGASHLRQKQKGMYTTYDETKQFTISVNAYPGISYAVSKKLHLETGFNNLLMVNYFQGKREPETLLSLIKQTGLM